LHCSRHPKRCVAHCNILQLSEHTTTLPGDTKRFMSVMCRIHMCDDTYGHAHARTQSPPLSPLSNTHMYTLIRILTCDDTYAHAHTCTHPPPPSPPPHPTPPHPPHTHTYVYTYIYIYQYVHVFICIYTYVYIYTHRSIDNDIDTYFGFVCPHNFICG